MKDILERIEQLERRAERSERIMRIIGEKMEDFDFDSLLGDLNTKEEKVEKHILDDLEDIGENILDDVDLLEDISTEEAEEPEETKIQTIETSTFETTGVEFAEETKQYARAFLDIEMRKRALTQEAKDLKDEYKEQGVDIASVNKAMRELAKELKESAEEAASIERIKELFKKDDRIYTEIVGLAD